MNANQRLLCEKLRSFSSSEAANWLIETFPKDKDNWGEAVILLPHRSWEKPDQEKLATYYLAKAPFASERPYAAFASVMSVRRLIRILRGLTPTKVEDRNLFVYHLSPVLKANAKSDQDFALVAEFLGELG